MKSVRPKDGPPGGDSNGWGDFRGTKRSDETHEASTTDSEARLARKSRAEGAKPAFSSHALIG